LRLFSRRVQGQIPRYSLEFLLKFTNWKGFLLYFYLSSLPLIHILFTISVKSRFLFVFWKWNWTQITQERRVFLADSNLGNVWSASLKQPNHI
jgi:hypothetical protein